MFKSFTLLIAVFLAAFISGCSESTSIFIEEVNILGIDDSDDSAAWLVSGALEEICEVPGVCPEGVTESGELVLPEDEFPGNDEDDDKHDTNAD